jgi:iron complex outermembrane receptor protein
MRKATFLLFALTFLTFVSFAQETRITGTVKDGYTGETLPNAQIVYNTDQVIKTDLDGHFDVILPNGSYTFIAKFTGYGDLDKTIEAKGPSIVLDFLLQSVDLKEVEIISDIAVDRKTPVAFSDISAIKLKEELGTQDLPMIMNTTPGVYATQTGGGDGDARVNIRGFNQRNVSVMVDGIPMNDMENGWVYWSNWFGLDVVTQKVQVQRGLGASKLAVPAIGGNINILSQGIDQKASLTYSSELGNNFNFRNTLGYNSGRLKNGWGITASLSYKRNDGWVTNLDSKQLFYFAKIQKEFKNQSLSFSVMGSPQQHYQRINRNRMIYYDVDYAVNQGVDTTGIDLASNDHGLRFNSEWGYITRNRYDENASREVLNARLNYYHKPILNLKHFWSINDRVALSNIVYASTGNGGGTRLNNSLLNSDGQMDFEYMYAKNTKTFYNFLGIPLYPYDTNYVDDTTQYKASYYIQSSRNNHVWYGILSTFKFKYNEQLEFSGGLDARYYKTERYQEVYDMLGADYVVVDASDQNNPTQVAREGDRFGYNINSFVRQAGVFLLGEYEYQNITAFLNLTTSTNQYNRVNLFGLKDADGDYPESGWKKFFGYTAKTGLKYRINKRQSAFFNAGYLNRAPLLANTFNGTSLNTYDGLENEIVTAIEGGYNFSSGSFKSTLNLYYTIWKNRPVTQSVAYGTETYYVSVPGMNALHQGVELDLNYNLNKKISLEGVVSIGDWHWTSDAQAIVTNEIGTVVIDTLEFDAAGVKVGDAAQTQFSAGIRFEPFKGLYFKPRITYFNNYFADFDPETLKGENSGRQSWKIPAYYTIDLNMGYNMPLADKYRLGFKVNLMNILDTTYISDARNNEYGADFDAASAGVYFGMGFRWNIGVTFSY